MKKRKTTVLDYKQL